MRSRLARVVMVVLAVLLPAGAAGPAAAAPLSLRGRVVVLDPGHNGLNHRYPAVINRLVYAGNGYWKPCNTTGTATAGGFTEAAFTFDIALRVRAILLARGARVVLTR